MPKFYTLKTMKKKTEKRFPFTGTWKDVFGLPTLVGMWIIYGAEKHGKTTFALMLADYLSKFLKVLYISAEEGVDADFIAATQRANCQEHTNRLTFCDIIELDVLEEMLTKKQHPKVIFVDNTSAYYDELKGGGVRRILQKYKHKVLFVFIAHEEKNEPDGAHSKLIKKFAKRIIRVIGLAAFVSGRGIVPNQILINDEKAMLYHGSSIKKPKKV
jgi:DNA polymerase III delta prime subunit